MTEPLPNFIREFASPDIPEYIISPLEYYAKLSPNSPAVITCAYTVTYSNFWNAVRINAEKLKQTGESENKVLLAVSDNVPHLLLLIWSCFLAGITVCPVNPKFPPELIKNIAVKTEAHLMWLGTCQKTNEELRKVLPEISEFSLDASGFIPDDQNTEIYTRPEFSPREILINTGSAADLILTSGSTGIPKAASHSIANHLFNADDGYSLSSDDRYLQSLPLFHIGGLAISFRCFTAGAAVVFSSSEKSLEKTIQNLKITHISLVPTQLYRLLKNGFEFQNTSLSRIMLGGGTITRDLLRSCIARGIHPFVSYGLTEMSSQVCTKQILNSDDIEDLHAGPALKNREIKIENNEILVKGKTLFLGYCEKGNINLKLDSEGFFHTGDCGYIKNGNLYICGRIDNQFTSGGENIQPEHIERVICELTNAPRAVVAGIKDQEWGEMAVAVIDGSYDNLKEKLKSCLAPHEIPKIFIPWPQTQDTGLKVQRKKIIEYAKEYVKNQTAQEGDR